MREILARYPIAQESTPEAIPDMVGKRCFDVILASIGLVVSLPLWLVFALAIRLEDGGPVFFFPEEVGSR